MGSTTPSSLNSRTSGVEDRWCAATAGIRKKIAQAHTPHKTKKAATNSNCLKRRKRFLSGDQSLIAHLLLVFSQAALNSANVRAVAWLPYSLAPASEPSPPPLARDPASSARDRSSPTSSEPRRNPLSPVTPVVPSPHRPFCRDGGQFRPARGAPRDCWDPRQARPGIPSPRRRGSRQRVLAGRAAVVTRRCPPANRMPLRPQVARHIQSPREGLSRRARSLCDLCAPKLRSSGPAELQGGR